MDNKNLYTVVIFYICFLIIGFYLGQLNLKRNIWTGIYYPDINQIDNQYTWVVSPPLYSLEECRNWVKIVSKGTQGDYNCSQKCRVIPDAIEKWWIVCKDKEK
ncbi:MAG TPA: hypothetical protein VK338_05980 [Candidatus Nitrosocosmicus sp.]|nr:hypothetical protein [Candidatus Nitrosocosmicus sp.]